MRIGHAARGCHWVRRTIRHEMPVQVNQCTEGTRAGHHIPDNRMETGSTSALARTEMGDLVLLAVLEAYYLCPYHHLDHILLPRHHGKGQTRYQRQLPV
jgi:hypothetical protein